MEQMNITHLLKAAGTDPVAAAFDAQLQHCKVRETKGGKPYLELTFVDAINQTSLKAWDNHPQFDWCQQLKKGAFVRVSGSWTQNQYGLDAKGWEVRPLNDAEAADLLSGDPKMRAFQQGEYNYIAEQVAAIAEPRLRLISETFLQTQGERFRRTAAARKNHHARRGGLVEHVAQMMRSANGFCSAYPSLNRDLLIAGILFHDCGKLWENCYPKDSFAQDLDLRGELLGHIPIGLQLVQRLWADTIDADRAQWLDEEVPSEHVRLHLLHLIGSHHGTHEFGSPVLPRTPEAHALHHIDNFDAKFEMFRDSYASSPQVAPGIYERRFPLPGHVIEPLPSVGNPAQV